MGSKGTEQETTGVDSKVKGRLGHRGKGDKEMEQREVYQETEETGKHRRKKHRMAVWRGDGVVK